MSKPVKILSFLPVLYLLDIMFVCVCVCVCIFVLKLLNNNVSHNLMMQNLRSFHWSTVKILLSQDQLILKVYMEQELFYINLDLHIWK